MTLSQLLKRYVSIARKDSPTTRQQKEADQRLALLAADLPPAYEEQDPHPPRVKITDLPIELLQHIFSFLSLGALLNARCVCKAWSLNIPGYSSTLSRSLFLPGPSAQPLTQHARVSLNFAIYCSRTSRKRETYVGRIDKVAFTHLHCFDEELQDSLQLNPYVAKIDRYLVAQAPNVEDRMKLRHFRFTALSSDTQSLWNPVFVPLLKPMTLTMPPLRAVECHFTYLVDGMIMEPWQGEKAVLLQRARGVTLVQMCDVFEKEVMGLLRDETMWRVKNASGRDSCSIIHEFRKKLREVVSPI
ncbi:hypothetical protein IQ07DRAFT_299399 [Pyrenochaeta sp. DS3sAY3a]|nr:hypothetical protein IQ07DRAFT_299399 [Pyrenochaeta sp. DS3sAY3a]